MPLALAETPRVEGTDHILRLIPNRSSERRPPAPLHELRATARKLDKAHTPVYEADAQSAFRLWEGLLFGLWTLVDCFDTDDRWFIIVRSNVPRSGRRRGLTKRERQVAMGAALGESSKATGYRLGISPSRVSALLKASMRKLGVKTKAQLIITARILSTQHGCTLSSSAHGRSSDG